MGLPAPWFALVLFFLTLCQTAFIHLTSLEGRPVANDSLATFVLSQINSSLAANPAQNQTVNTDLEEFDYDIPSSSRFVGITIDKDRPMDPNSFHRVIETSLARVSNHIAVHGNGPLQPQDHPFLVLSGDCYLEVQSDLKPDRTLWLTYKILLETIIGLKITLDDERRYFRAGFSTADMKGPSFAQGVIAKAPQVAGAASMSIETEK